MAVGLETTGVQIRAVEADLATEERCGRRSRLMVLF
jgi:hypothetical protein